MRVQAPGGLRGHLAPHTAVRPDLGEITYTVEAETDADAETLEAIREAAEASSPVSDDMISATPVRDEVRKTGGARAV